MSLAHSRAPRHNREADEPRPLEKEGWVLSHSLRSEPRPRFVSQPKSGPDEATHDSPAKTNSGNAYVHPHGNTKPGEPSFLQRRPSTSLNEPRKAGHIHPRPWTTCPAPGKKENPHQENIYYRTWMSDCGVSGRPLAPSAKEFPSDMSRVKPSPHGTRLYDFRALKRAESEPRRWTRERKKEFYALAQEELMSSKCADEMFAVGANAKMWTHLLDHGVTRGGQAEKVDVCPKRKTGQHCKSGIYKGKFENVRHSQVIFRSRRKTTGNARGKEAEDWQVDTRAPFDTRVKDDMIQTNFETDQDFAVSSFDLQRPTNTRSCPQMGAEWMHR